MKVELFSILDFKGNTFSDPQMLPLYLDHYRERFPNCIFNIYLNNYPDNYNGEEIKILKSKKCNIRTIELGDNTLYYTVMWRGWEISQFPEPDHRKIGEAFNKYIVKEQRFKNNIWKRSDADWVIVCDIDELVHISEEELKDEVSDVIKFVGYNMVRYAEDSSYSDLTCGYKDVHMHKSCVFRPIIDEINYSLGAHKCEPKKNGKTVKVKDSKYKLLHYRKRSLDLQNEFYKHYSKNIEDLIENVNSIIPSRFVITEKGWWITESKNNVFYNIGNDESLAKELVRFFKQEGVNDIADFGSGHGFFVNYLRDNGLNAEGYDGNPNNPNVVLDLAKPIALDKDYEWMISLEVGEHIPKKYEDVFIQNLHKHNKKGLIITWAPPSQPGHGHINCQSQEYIRNKVVRLGYTVDEKETEHLKNSCSIWWLANNLLVFRKKLKIC